MKEERKGEKGDVGLMEPGVAMTPFRSLSRIYRDRVERWMRRARSKLTGPRSTGGSEDPEIQGLQGPQGTTSAACPPRRAWKGGHGG